MSLTSDYVIVYYYYAQQEVITVVLCDKISPVAHGIQPILASLKLNNICANKNPLQY